MVNVVVNYDAPSYTKTYLHREGRTARAGRPGTALTLLKGDQVRHFKKMMAKVSRPPPPESGGMLPAGRTLVGMGLGELTLMTTRK